MSEFRCSLASRERGEDLAGTASTVRNFLLVEHAGAWGRTAWTDARLPEGLGREVTRRAAAAKVRPLLMRSGSRHARPRASGGHSTTGTSRGVTVLAASAAPGNPRLERLTLNRIEDLLDLDLLGIASGAGIGGTPVAEPVLAVCTHGKHDACCAERGRPVAAAARDAGLLETWEVSHIGGDRFAGNAVVLPHGFYYGGLDADSVGSVLSAHAAGNLDLAHLRGRSSYAMPVQFAEIALRRHLGEARVDAVRMTHRHPEGRVFHTEFAHGDDRWRVLVRTSPGEPGRLTCHAARPEPAPVHEVVSLERV